jgi:hypothetical protein
MVAHNSGHFDPLHPMAHFQNPADKHFRDDECKFKPRLFCVFGSNFEAPEGKSNTANVYTLG